MSLALSGKNLRVMAATAEVPRFVLRPHPESARRARALVADALFSHVDPETVHHAAVVVSELVTNAVIHANTTVTVGLRLLPGGAARIEVGDSSSWPPTRKLPTLDEPGGRGLVLVEALAETWGVTPTPEGKTVWAEIVPAHRPAHALVSNEV